MLAQALAQGEAPPGAELDAFFQQHAWDPLQPGLKLAFSTRQQLVLTLQVYNGCGLGTDTHFWVMSVASPVLGKLLKGTAEIKVPICKHISSHFLLAADFL